MFKLVGPADNPDNKQDKWEVPAEMLPGKIYSTDGGSRQPIGKRFDLLFQEFGDALNAWAEVIDYGEKKHGHLNWHKLDFSSEQNPINHAVGHLIKGMNAKPGAYRRRQFAKALWNIGAQMWKDKQNSTDPIEGP